jgi:hypothetical protein
MILTPIFQAHEIFVMNEIVVLAGDKRPPAGGSRICT